MKSLLKVILKEPVLSGLDRDHPDTTHLYRSVIQKKPALYQVYQRIYQKYKDCATRCPKGGLLVEIGSGGGFAKEFMPELITTDILPLENVDQVADAQALPWDDESVSGIFMQSVLHHVPNPRQFFSEALRVLKPGGRVFMLEPYHGPLASLIRKNLHHEPYDEKAIDWALPPGGPLSMSNVVMPWIIFCRDRKQFEQEFPEFEIQTSLHTILSYFITGGITYRSLVPAAFMPALFMAEKALSPLNPLLAYFLDIELTKR
jgi:SAM-dependent methyltransferase